jgi:hypothetical protein
MEHLAIVKHPGAGQARLVKSGETFHECPARHNKGCGDMLATVVDAVIAAVGEYFQQLKGGE